MVFSPNDSPLAGREGSHLTGSKIGERLANEAATSVSLRVLPVKGGGEAFEVQARGELQLGLLIGALHALMLLSAALPAIRYRVQLLQTWRHRRVSLLGHSWQACSARTCSKSQKALG